MDNMKFTKFEKFLIVLAIFLLAVLLVSLSISFFAPQKCKEEPFICYEDESIVLICKERLIYIPLENKFYCVTASIGGYKKMS